MGERLRHALGSSDGLSDFPLWRRLMQGEEFDYNFLPTAGNRRGYAVATDVLLFGHENCGCMRGGTPNKIVWFLPHSDRVHGPYPMPFENEEVWLRVLRAQLPSLRPGFVLRIGILSYGALFDRHQFQLHQTEMLLDMIRIVCRQAIEDAHDTPEIQ